MIKRGGRWHFKARIPADLHDYYGERTSKFIEESLRTSDVTTARRVRDAKLKVYQGLWAEMRIRNLTRTEKGASKETGYEPPRVYRRVSGSMIKLLFRQRSRFRRIPPLLLAA